MAIFAVIAFTYVISYFHRAAPAVVGPIIATELGLSPSQLGLFGSAYFWAYALTAFPSGLLADSWGARRTIALFVLLAAVGGAVFAVSGTVEVLAASRFIIGLGVGVVYVAALRIFSDWYAADELATYSGLLLAFGNLGALLSTTPLVVAIDLIGWRPAFVVVAALTAIAAAASYLVIRDRPADLGGVAARPSAPNGALRTLVESARAILSERRIYLLGGLLFSFYGTFMGVGSLWAGPYLQAVHHLDKQQAGAVLLLFPLGMAIGCPVAGWLSDKVFRSRRSVLLWGGVGHLLGYVPLVFFTGSLERWMLMPLFFWYGLSGSAFVVCFACVKELYPARYAGAAVGALNIFLFTGGAFYQSLIGTAIGWNAGLEPAAVYARVFALPMTGLAAGLVLFLAFREGRGDVASPLSDRPMEAEPSCPTDRP
jgi:sugar phosphate permease